MAWNVAPYDAATVMRRSGCDSTESLMTMFRARSFPPLRVFDACTTAIPSKRTYCSLVDHNEEIGEDDTLFAAADSPHHVEKKKRLTTAQVRSLEVSFESDNKLEPERKQQLADQLGLQPRQVAVWFQNRRARWKTKRLEHDYDVLKADYVAVVVERDRLRAEIVRLTAELQARGGKEEGNDVEESQEQHLIEAIGGPNEEMLLHEPDSHGIPGQVLDHLSPQAAESLALNNNDSPVSSDCSDILDEGSPNPIDISIEQMPPYPQLVKVEYDDSACISSVVGYPQVYQQLAVKVEEGLLLEESNLNLFSVDEHELQWLWLN